MFNVSHKSLEKGPQLPGPNHPYYVRKKKSPAILKTLICSTACNLCGYNRRRSNIFISRIFEWEIYMFQFRKFYTEAYLGPCQTSNMDLLRKYFSL